jgi:putative OPT family oligopeptide transporter
MDPPAVISEHAPYVPADVVMPELTWPAVAMGVLLGIIFGASSLYLVLKVGMTVSASIPVAVLSITLFRLFAWLFGIRRATILENNIVQTTGSAGESIAFGVGVTIPALMLLGFDMKFVQVMTVATLGGLLGILMMIPLRRAFIVKQHRVLTYPEGTACADVLIVGEQGGASAATVFVGFGLAFVYKFLANALHMWSEKVFQPLWQGTRGLRGATVAGELSPELLGVGYIIGPRIASLILGGGVLAYLVIAPLIVSLGSELNVPYPPATDQLIRDMNPDELRNNYILYIGAGAVATGGIISMVQALPMILASIVGGLRDMRGIEAGGARRQVPRTARDLPIAVTVVGSLLLVVALSLVPDLGLGTSLRGWTGSALIVVFGFLFVTVSARLTGAIGSSSNPISGMTVATLLLTCLVFLAMGETGPESTFTALMVAAVVCIAASNGGTTAQDLKTGFLVGSTPRAQQLAILIGSLTSASVIGLILIMMNQAGTVWSAAPENLPSYRVEDVSLLTTLERPGGEYAEKDTNEYHVLHVRQGEIVGVLPGKYLVDDTGEIRYLVDPAINGRLTQRDDHTKVDRFEAPKTRLMALIIDGILNQRLPWELVMLGALISITLELAGTASLPFAVGVYLPLSTSMPIFIGGLVRWAVDKLLRRPAAESEMSPGVMLGSGYIAGGAIAGVLIAFFTFLPKNFVERLAIGHRLPEWLSSGRSPEALALGMFCLLIVVLFVVGLRRKRDVE